MRKLTVTLAIALLMFVLAPMASADEITTPGGNLLIIPDGSQVTSVFILPLGFGCGLNAIGVDFQFQDGTGSTGGCFNGGDFTSIVFTVPVTDLSLTLLLGANANELSADGATVFECFFFPSSPTPCPEGVQTIDLTLSGPVSALSWDSEQGFSGIESLSFTADAGDPPTSSLILLGFGLIGLLASSRRKDPVCP